MKKDEELLFTTQKEAHFLLNRLEMKKRQAVQPCLRPLIQRKSVLKEVDDIMSEHLDEESHKLFLPELRWKMEKRDMRILIL